MQRLGVVELEQVRLALEHAGGEVGDVAARVAALRRRLALDRGEDGQAEVVHLVAGVVDVVLVGDVGAGSAQHPADRVAEGRPAGVADVQRAGGVRRDELEVDGGTGERGAVPVGGAGLDDGLRERAGGCGIESDVDEARTGDLDARRCRRRR